MHTPKNQRPAQDTADQVGIVSNDGGTWQPEEDTDEDERMTGEDTITMWLQNEETHEK